MLCIGTMGPALAALDIPTKEVAPGVKMPVLSIGTGGTESHNASAIVQNWLSQGGRGVDTAMVYRDQPVVAKAIADAGVDRKDIFITTKIPGCIGAAAAVHSDLRQLKTDYIDLMLIHFPYGGDCGETWAVLEDFHARGVLKSIGVSNFNASQLEGLMKTAKVVPAVNQIRHNILSHDDQTINVARAHGITIEAYSPLGRNSGEIPSNKVIQEMARKYNVSTYQIALRWIVQHGHVLTFQSTSSQHQANDADIFHFTLADPDMAVLDNLQKHTAQVFV